MKRSDYLLIGAGVGLVGLAYYWSRSGFVSIADAAASARRTLAEKLSPTSNDNLAYQGANAVASAVAGRPTTVGSVAADVLPSAAEKQVNAPGFWISPGKWKQPIVATGDPFAYVDTYHPAPFDAPPFLLTDGPNLDTAAPIYDQLGNRIH
jgi:hypothetical protein